MTTRSGAIYNRAITSSAITNSEVTSSATVTPITDSVKRCKRILTTKLQEDKSLNSYVLRSGSTSFSKEYIREYCGDSDNDSTSTYDSEEEDEEIKSYTKNIFQAIAPKYEVHIDFDEASTAWRSNKRRVGESWVYKKKVNDKPQVNAKIPQVRVATPKPTMVTRSSNRRR